MLIVIARSLAAAALTLAELLRGRLLRPWAAAPLRRWVLAPSVGRAMRSMIVQRYIGRNKQPSAGRLVGRRTVSLLYDFVLVRSGIKLVARSTARSAARLVGRLAGR